MAWLRKLGAWLDVAPPIEAEGLLFDGVVKPTTTLARMIVVELLKDTFKPVGELFDHPKFRLTWSVGFPEIKDVKPTRDECDQARQKHGHSAVWRDEYSKPNQCYYKRSVAYATELARSKQKERVVLSVSVGNLGCSFDYVEKEIIRKGLIKALALHEERLKNKEAFDNQQKAVDALAGWMGVDTKE